MAAVPPDVSVHILPPGAGSKRDDSPLAYRDVRAAQRRIDRAYEASTTFLKELM
jgi:NTE family protein